jgi:hypothetical protein
MFKRKRQSMSDETKIKIGLANKGKPNGKKGKKLSDETKKKISIANKGRRLTEEQCRAMSIALAGRKQSKETIQKRIDKMTGQKRTAETREKMSKAKLGSKLTEQHKMNISIGHLGLNKGEKHCNWKGGVVPENKKTRSGTKFKKWRLMVFNRDNYICQKCKDRGTELNPHHIYNFSEYKELRFDINNGITFCRKCHYKFHKKYGYKNNDLIQINNFMEKDSEQFLKDNDLKFVQNSNSGQFGRIMQGRLMVVDSDDRGTLMLLDDKMRTEPSIKITQAEWEELDKGGYLINF